MKILITGVAGFVGSHLAVKIANTSDQITLIGIDNLSRRGSENNLPLLRKLDCQFIHGDIRHVDDVAALPKADWIVDCAANPSVLAGVEGGSAQVVGHNLIGTLNLLEKCRKEGCGFLMLSTSRVYSIESLCSIPLREKETRLTPDLSQPLPLGFSSKGINETFSKQSPISLYGATKLASEVMALEYASAYHFPIWINRCGLIAGAGQFGNISQGTFSFWVYHWILGKPLSYISFGGQGKQVRDCLCPEDLARLVCLQIAQPDKEAPKVVNVGGGTDQSMSLKELSQYCREKLNIDREIASVPQTRPFDIPYYVTDNTLVQQIWGWQPEIGVKEIIDAIIAWAQANQSVIASGF